MDSIRVSIIQTDIVWENKQENLRLLHEKHIVIKTELSEMPVVFE